MTETPTAVDPHVFVLFGATGDLCRRKLLPAVFRLTQRGHLRNRHVVLGVARDDGMDETSFRAFARGALLEAGFSEEELDVWCDACLFYQPIQGDGGDDDYTALKARLEHLEAKRELPGNRAYYLAVPPKVFPVVIEGLGRHGLNRSEGWTRLIVEKPFGHDLASAQELNATVHAWFDESQIYRIDHYLGKETVQNLLVFRFANQLFESQWNRNAIDHVQITVAESIGVGTRAGYYDGVGALRDMLQNHVAQVLTLTAMEVPASYDADSIRNEKIKVLRSIRAIDPAEVVFGRYTNGVIGDEKVQGYLEEENIPADSRTETFVAAQLHIDNWRWQGVPFYVRTGKRLPERLTEIVVTFRKPPVQFFETMDLDRDFGRDRLIITLQPHEGFELQVDVKRPDSASQLAKVPLTFRYGDTFGKLPDAYVTLLLDALTGDQTLFVHSEEVEQSWALLEPLLDGSIEIAPYEAGTWGPSAAKTLIGESARDWRA